MKGCRVCPNESAREQGLVDALRKNNIALGSVSSILLIMFCFGKVFGGQPTLGSVSINKEARKIITLDARQAIVQPHSLPLNMGGKSPNGHDIGVNSQYLTMDGKPWLPVMGEFHFSRYPERYWEEELLKMKAAGIQIVATYVFWIHHEEIEGEFDWSGQHDLRHVRGNQLHDIGGDGIVVVATDGALVEHNVVGHANQRSDGYNVAIWAWSADNTVIQYNEAYETKGQRDGEGFDSDWNSQNTVIQYNYSHDNDGGFLLICNEGGHNSEESAGNTGTVVRYNISQNDRTRGINIAGPVKDSLIYNNTIYVGPRHTVDLLLFSDWHGWSESSHFYNNIFHVAGTAQFSFGISRAPDGAYTTAPGFGTSKENVFDSNLYYGVKAPADDPHALTVDPKLAAPGHGSIGRLSLFGYRLQPMSPAKKSGKFVEKNGGHDFWGSAVPSCDATDRGASQSDGCNTAKRECRQ